MNGVSRFIKNIGVTILTTTASPVLSLVLVTSIARLMGVAELGTYTLITSFFIVFHVPSAVSLNYLLTREMAAEESKAELLYCSSLYVGLLLSVVCTVLCGLTVTYLQYSGDVVAANWIVALGLLPSFPIALNDAVFMSHGRNEFITYTTLSENAFKVVASLVAMTLGYGIVAPAVILTLGRILAACVGCLILIRKYFTPSLRFEFETFRALLRRIPVFTLTYSLAVIFITIDGRVLKLLMV